MVRPCQVMKKTVIPQVRKRGLLRKVAFAIVNPDRDRDLADQLTGGGPVPQLVMYRKTTKGWCRQALVGGQSVEAVEAIHQRRHCGHGNAPAPAEKAKASDVGRREAVQGEEVVGRRLRRHERRLR